MTNEEDLNLQERAATLQHARAMVIEAAENRVRRMVIPLTEIASEVASVVDEGIRYVREEHRAPEPACREGCSYCCYIPHILVTLPELQRIADAVSKWSREDIDALNGRIDTFMAQVSGRTLEDLAKEVPTVPCPLLVNDRCSVYAVRPLVCRGYHSHDVERCKTDFETASGDVPQFALVTDVVTGAMRGVSDLFRAIGLPSDPFELSHGLKLILANSNAAPQWLAGRDSLQGAVDQDWRKITDSLPWHVPPELIRRQRRS